MEPEIRLLVREPGQPERLVTLAADATVGRAQSNTLCLADPAASRNHLRVALDGRKWFVEDVGSASGTLVDGERTLRKGERAELRNGSLLTVGDTQIVVGVDVETQDGPLPTLQAPAEPDPQPEIERTIPVVPPLRSGRKAAPPPAREEPPTGTVNVPAGRATPPRVPPRNPAAGTPAEPAAAPQPEPQPEPQPFDGTMAMGPGKRPPSKGARPAEDRAPPPAKQTPAQQTPAKQTPAKQTAAEPTPPEPPQAAPPDAEDDAGSTQPPPHDAARDPERIGEQTRRVETTELQGMQMRPKLLARNARLVVVGGGERRCVAVEQSPFVIGRGQHAQLMLTDSSISTEHARLSLDAAGEFVLVDLGSRNGTFVGGEALPAAQPRTLRLPARLRFGTVEGYLVDDPSSSRRQETIDRRACDLLVRAGRLTAAEKRQAIDAARAGRRHVAELVLQQTRLGVGEFCDAADRAGKSGSSTRWLLLLLLAASVLAGLWYWFYGRG